MCKNPLYATRYSPIVQAYDGEYIKDPTYPFDKMKKLRFLRNCDHDRFNLLQSEDTYGENHREFFKVPCGQCIECRLAKSREWANRIICESVLSRNNMFLTLTYDDKHLPKGRGSFATLVPDHLKKFCKDLRRYCEYHFNHTGIRFYGAGEYGSTSLRPHYHICLFNLPDDLIRQNIYYKKSFNGDLYFNNPILEQIWDRGYAVAADLCYKSAAYVARYTVKKISGKAAADHYAILGIEPEFARMSRRPGIGRDFFEKHKDEIYETDSLYLPSVGKQSPSKYFDKLYALENPEVMESIRGTRVMTAELQEQYKLSKTDLDYDSYMKVEQEDLMNRIKKLVRPLD